MKIVKIKGGLGNQLFQYAFIKYLEKLTQNEVYADKNMYQNYLIRNFELNKIDRNLKYTSETKEFKFGSFLYKISVLIKALLKKGYYLEEISKYKKLLECEYYDGYWQDLKYINEVEKELKQIFKNKSFFDKKNKIEEDSVAIGFRRGDYLNKKNKKIYEECPLFYYKEAITLIKEKIKKPVFYIFSDDIKSIKNEIETLLKGEKYFYINENKENSPLEELVIMSKCSNAIIPNSTFSWWGAWLSENKNKIVIVPKYWYKSNKIVKFIPKEWISMDNRRHS